MLIVSEFDARSWHPAPSAEPVMPPLGLQERHHPEPDMTRRESPEIEHAETASPESRSPEGDVAFRFKFIDLPRARHFSRNPPHQVDMVNRQQLGAQLSPAMVELAVAG